MGTFEFKKQTNLFHYGAVDHFTGDGRQKYKTVDGTLVLTSSSTCICVYMCICVCVRVCLRPRVPNWLTSDYNGKKTE